MLSILERFVEIVGILKRYRENRLRNVDCKIILDAFLWIIMKTGLPTGMIRKRLEPDEFLQDSAGRQRTPCRTTDDRPLCAGTDEAARRLNEPVVQFTYDYLRRRVQKVVKNNWNGTSGTTVTHLRYVYDGNNLIAELDASGNSVTVLSTYVWGLDLSGTNWGAGGVGGLLMIKDGSAVYFPGYDGNGNVSGLVDSADGTLDAKYEYGAFGEPLRVGGTTIAADNPFRFSTKYTDTETGLVYYGFRYYSPSLGRFLNRDPIGEEGGTNLYAFVENDPVNGWDYLGLDDELICDPADYSAGFCDDDGPRKRGFLKRLGSFFGGIGQGIINTAGNIGRGVVSTAAKVARAAVKVEQPQVVTIIVSANGEIKLDGYTVVGKKGPVEKRIKADSDFRKELEKAIAEIQSSLIAKGLRVDPQADEASKALFWFIKGLAEYKIEFHEVKYRRNPPTGGTNRAGSKGFVYWEPGRKIETKWNPLGTGKPIVTVSQPHHILAHEIAHALYGLEHSREMRERLKSFDTGQYTNAWESMAIEFENLVRDPGDVRHFHNPDPKEFP